MTVDASANPDRPIPDRAGSDRVHLDRTGLDREGLLEAFRWIALTRAAEERLQTLQRQGHHVGSIFRSLGQEAGAVGAALALDRREDGGGDVVAPSLRAGGAALVFGASLEDYFRQFLGRATGPSRGRESGIHWADLSSGLLGPVTPLGLMVEVMAGVTLSFKLRGEERVGLVFHGDGGTSTGAWHEGLGMAAAQRCPMVLVVENNQWAFGTPTDKNTRLDSFTEKGPAYGIAGSPVDGTDVGAVFSAVSAAVRRARSGDGVQMVELRYFRRAGHVQHDAMAYVDPADVSAWERQDPLAKLTAALTGREGVTEQVLARIRKEAEEACASAASTALADPLPDGADALGGVYTDLAPRAPWTRPSLSDERLAS